MWGSRPPLILGDTGFDHLHENWNRNYDPATGRYLHPEPLMAAPSYALFKIKWEQDLLLAYSYASDNPIANIDENGLQVKRQFKRDGSFSRAAASLDNLGKERVYEKCAAEGNQFGDECRKKDTPCKQPSIAPSGNPTPAAAAAKALVDKCLQEQRDACEKVARCTFQACAAAFDDKDRTRPVYDLEFTKCMGSK